MTAVIYARYSSDNQREESIEGQIRECTAYAEKNGITVVKHYIDRALSAKTDNRPDFQQMIKDSEKRLFDIVLVWKLDRFARNRYDSAHYEYQLERNHVKLVSATEPISDSPAGIMVKSMLTGMAEYYSAELSEKVVRGMTENVLKGKYNGGTIPIGFKVDEEKFFQIDPLKAPFVVEAFQRYNDGATMKELMNWLNDSGVTTNRNQKFTYNSVQKLLTNKRYIGENHFKDIVMPDSIPAIVDKDLFEEVQLKIKKNSRAPARHKAEDDYLLTTKLFCGMCGAMMFGECGTGRNKVVHHYYKCATAKRFKTCKKKTVRKEWLEDLVIAETMKLIQDDAVIDAIVAEVMELQDQENTFGRYKESGAPFGKKDEFDEVDLSKLPVDSHVRLAKEVDLPILRRSYSYSDGIDERTGQFDAGLIFIAYQKDPDRFVKIQTNLGAVDKMNEYITHIGSGLFACFAGVEKGGYLGQALFE